MLTQDRLKEKECLIHKLRRDPRLWTEDRIIRIILHLKEQCGENWESRTHKLSEKRMQNYMM